MLTLHDIEALVELLQRTPMTKPEQLFAGRLVETLMAMAEKPDSPTEEPEAEGAGDANRHDHE